MPTDNTSNDFLDYNLPQNAYVAFDAVSLKDYIINRLNENEKFTDQNYEGSNLAAVIDIIAYSYHVLLFYLNNTAAEVNFDQATLYENMNKIVKLIGYKPTGRQTSIVPINATASSSLTKGNYTLRKYSYFLADGIQYNFIDDFSFTKTTADEEGLKELDNDKYYEYKEVDSLYLTNSVDRVYERRLNESGNYEIKFGNGVFGKLLTEGDTVSINYILSDNTRGIISKNIINGNNLFVYDSTRQRQIFIDTYANKDETSFLNTTNSSFITFNNPLNSTTLSDAETVDQIRENAPKIFSSQLRLVTEGDYESYLNKNLPTVLNSTKVVSNESYINEYIQYFYDICVDPNKVNRILLNQINFADSCDFNNINIFVVPKFILSEDKSYPTFVSTSFKNLIVEMCQDRKMVSNIIVPRDPVYMAFGLGIDNQSTLNLNILDKTKLYLVRETNNKINKETLKARVDSLIKAFFLPANNDLGQHLQLINLSNDILSLEGIKRIFTKNTNGTIFQGISFLSFNPMYPESDIELVNQDTTLQYFKFPYLYSPLTVAERIEVIDE